MTDRPMWAALPMLLGLGTVAHTPRSPSSSPGDTFTTPWPADRPGEPPAPMDAEKPSRRGWLTPALILGPPWAAVAVWVAVAFGCDQLPVPLGEPTLVALGFAHLLLAAAGSGAGGMTVRGPTATRVAVGTASTVYGGATAFGLLQLLTWLINP